MTDSDTSQSEGENPPTTTKTENHDMIIGDHNIKTTDKIYVPGQRLRPNRQRM